MVWERRISRAVGAHAPGEHLDDGGTLGRGRSLVYGNGDQRRAELGSSGTPRAGGIHRTWDLVSEREIGQIWIGALAGAGVCPWMRIGWASSGSNRLLGWTTSWSMASGSMELAMESVRVFIPRTKPPDGLDSQVLAISRGGCDQSFGYFDTLMSAAMGQ